MKQMSEIKAATVTKPSSLPILFQIVLTMLVLSVGIVTFSNSFWLSTLTSAFALALAARGVTLLFGQLGLVSLCQVALIGVGGWIALRLNHATDLPFEMLVLLAGCGASALGMVWGAPALRLQGLYLALVTLMLAGVYQTVIGAVGFPDGGEGFLGRADATQRVMMARPPIATDSRAYFLYVAAWVTFGFVLVEAFRIGKSGRSWALIRKGRQAAQSAAVNLFVYKMLAFGLAGFLAGAAGALLAGNVGQLDGRTFPASESLFLFALAVVGGCYNWYGALIAGLLLRAVPSLLTDFGVNGYVAIIVFGTALLHALVTAPNGIAGQISALIQRLRPENDRTDLQEGQDQ